MANSCGYEIHVKGTKKAALFLAAMLPTYDSKDITHEEGTDEEYIVWVEGNCKWALDYACSEKSDVKIDLDALTLDDVQNDELGVKYWYLTMRQKSEVLNVEILAHSWSKESEFECYEHYKEGRLLDSKKDTHYLPDELQDYDLFPKWLSDQFKTYEAFCAAVEEHFGFSINEISEDQWELEKEGVRFLNNDNWLDFAMDYMESLYPSSNFGFAF